MAYALNGDAGNGGVFGGGPDPELGNCNQQAASSFIGLEDSGFDGSGGFGPPNLAFASRRNACAMQRYKLAGSPAPVPSAQNGMQISPLLVIILILILIGVLS